MKQIYLFLSIAFFTLCSSKLQAQIVITEIMYNSPESGTDLGEYIELFNAGNSIVDLTGYSFSQGVTHTFTGGSINPNEYFIITVNMPELDSRYGAGTADAQWTSGGLSNGGEDIELLDDFSQVVDYVNYDDNAPWPIEPDGVGSSLRLCDPTLDNSLGSNWTSSDESTGVTINGFELKGTPGQAADCSTLSTSAIQETQKISFYPNPSSDFIQISGLTNTVNYSAFNALGAKVSTGTISNNEKINIQNLTNGLYFLKLENGNTIKFIKK